MIEVSHVTKRFRRLVAVDDVSFTVARGEALALWGSNGAGKTTLIRCLLGVIRFAGDVVIDGVDLREDGKRARALTGYVPQELAFHDDARLGAAMAFFASLRRVKGRDAARALRTVGLEESESKRLRDLSGGMKQRLALAIALLSDPPIVVLDEPTSNLDAEGRRNVVDSLKRLRRSGKTLIFASHRPDEIAALADRVLVLESGRLIRATSPKELWSTDGSVRTLRLHVPSGAEETALDALRRAGHIAELNGNGLCVVARWDEKAEPIATLSRAAIHVHDFDVLDGVGAPGEDT